MGFRKKNAAKYYRKQMGRSSSFSSEEVLTTPEIPYRDPKKPSDFGWIKEVVKALVFIPVGVTILIALLILLIKVIS